MSDVVGVARLVLVAVFAVAGWAKLSDRAGTRRAVREFGVPDAVATPVTFLLPLAELIVAALLLFSGTAVIGAIGAAALLGLFIVAIGVSLARGRRPDCHCFGQVHSEPVGPATLVRNAVLIGVAAVIIADGTGGTNFWDWFADLTTTGWIAVAAAVIGAVALGVLAWLVVNLIAQQGRLLNRIDTLEAALGIEPELAAAPQGGLPVGTVAPDFDLESTAGDRVSLRSLVDVGNPVLLLFTTPDCGPCNTLMPEVAGWGEVYAGALTVAVVGAGDADRNRAKAAEHGLDRILLQERDEVFNAYSFLGTPSAVVVSAEGKIASPLVAGADAVRALAGQAASGQLAAQRWIPVGMNGHGPAHDHDHEPPLPPPGPPIGEPAPAISLPDLEGSTVSLAGLRGQSTLVLFWNPGCGFCAGMLDELRDWDHSRTNGAPQLLVVSSGTPEAHAEMQLRSPVVLDARSETMSAYGAHGTPMGVLVDDEGNVASALAVGAVEVMNLARSEVGSKS
jgi:peroxiredoxin